MRKRKLNKINRRRIFFDAPECKIAKLDALAKKLNSRKSRVCRDVIEWFLSQDRDKQIEILTHKIVSKMQDD